MEEMYNNVARNIAGMSKDSLKMAVDNNISLGFENLPGNQIFTTPESLNKLRDLTVKELVKSGKLSQVDAEKLIGFTFDFSHANKRQHYQLCNDKDCAPSRSV